MRLAADPDIEPVRKILEEVRKAGGRAFLVGGPVRDRILAAIGKGSGAGSDLDLEVHGLAAERLERILKGHGRVNPAGRKFGIYKLEGTGTGEVSVGLPRRERKNGSGHRAFEVTCDPGMGIEEAARRRDFTVNALMWDPLGGEVIDPFGGREDLEKRRLRAVDPARFGEDSLRVLRAVQFAGRLEFEIEDETAEICRTLPLDDLSATRILGELEKLLLSAARPSIGLATASDLGVTARLFPELEALVGCEQDPAWHPEGDVWIHTLQAVDVAAGLLDGLDRARRITVMLAVLAHDLGKPAVTRREGERIRAIAHETAGLAPATALLDRLDLHTVDGFDVRATVLALVADHLKPMQWHKEKPAAGVFRRLALRCDPDLLYRVARADVLGRRAPGKPEPDAAAPEWFRERMRELAATPVPPPKLLGGRRAIELGAAPGPEVGRIVAAVYELQLDGAVTTAEEAEAAARRLLAGG